VNGNHLIRGMPRSVAVKRMISDLAVGTSRVGTLQYPVSIQFPVNDTCNSACKMCNIWQQKERNPITPEELDDLLQSPLFDHVRTVGLNGGEPTLRKDLGIIAGILVRRLGQLQKVALITNAFHPPTVLSRVRDIRYQLAGSQVAFDVMVSLDGWGSVHDEVRGKPGNFDNAFEVIDAIQSENLADHLRIGSTIIDSNVVHMEELRFQLARRQIPVNFRVGVPHRRLYIGSGEPFQLSVQQTDHLLRFLANLVDTATQLDERRNYRSVLEQIAYSRPRAVGCDFQGRAITLTSRRDLALCPVVGGPIGNATRASAEADYFAAGEELDKIIATSCDSCVHDYRGPRSRSETLALAAEVAGISGKARSVRSSLLEGRISRDLVLGSSAAISDVVVRVRDSRRRPGERNAEWLDVLILGWWGTETIGDQAILAGIARSLELALGRDARVGVVSVEQFVTDETLRAIGCEPWSVLTLDAAEDVIASGAVGVVLIGGGPLLAIRPLKQLEHLFLQAARSGARTAVVGCGVGPLGGRWATQSIKNIVRSADFVGLRDDPSLNAAHQLGARLPVLVSDPALWFLATCAPWKPLDQDMPTVLAARQPDPLYRSQVNRQVELPFAELLADQVNRCDIRFRAVAMHSYHVGGDDRWFLREVAANCGRVDFSWVRDDLSSVTHLFAEAPAIVAGRYHAFLFGAALGVPTVALDYSGRDGKMSALASSLGLGAAAIDVWTRSIDLPQTLEASQRLDWLGARQQLVERGAVGLEHFISWVRSS
jgi:polysaccharide pyruvyl transferase WcaK-like protein/molybdenum cofactor biosynthesis enzyme MoaA